MSAIADSVRNLIGDGETLKAIEALESHLRTGDSDLYNQVIHQKGQFNAFRKRDNLGLGADPATLAKINYAILEIVTEVDKEEEGFFTPSYSSNPARSNQQYGPGTPESPPASEFVAQCFFYNDPNQYFVNQFNQIIAYNPISNLRMPVAQRVPSNDPRFLWLYYFSNGMFYSIDHQGAIWGQNMFGMPMQMGYVRYL